MVKNYAVPQPGRMSGGAATIFVEFDGGYHGATFAFIQVHGLNPPIIQDANEKFNSFRED
jgi:hypothetical protein